MQLSRRDVLKLGVLGSAALALPLERVARTQLAASGRLPAALLSQLQFVLPFAEPPTLIPQTKTIRTDLGTPAERSVVVDYYEIDQRAVDLQVLPTVTKTGAPTNLPRTTIWTYDGTRGAAQPMYGGTIKVDAGKEVVVRQSNKLPDHPTLLYEPATSTHLHGSASLPQFDGYASDVTKQGEMKYQIPGNVAIVGMQVYTRTNGPPFGPHAGRPEAPEPLGMLTCLAELALVVLLLRLLGERVGRAVTTGILLVGVAAWALRIEGTLL